MFLYSANSTMKMIGEQRSSLLCKGGIALDDFKNVINAHRANKTNNYFEIGADAFFLGYIYGKRAERSKKKTG